MFSTVGRSWRVDSFEKSRPLTLHGARGRDGDDGVAATREDCSSGYRRCRCRRESERRVDDEGHEAEESPEALRAVRARGEDRARSARCAVLVRTVVSARNARSAVGHQSASTVVSALSARSAVGHQSASTVVSALNARSAVGDQSASTVVSAIHARSAVVHQSASTVVGAIDAKIATRRNSSFIRPKGSRGDESPLTLRYQARGWYGLLIGCYPACTPGSRNGTPPAAGSAYPP